MFQFEELAIFLCQSSDDEDFSLIGQASIGIKKEKKYSMKEKNS